jgi:hypothetical protein
MAVRCTEIDADFILGDATTATRCAALSDRHVRERHQRDCRQKTTRDLPHKASSWGEKTATSLRTTTSSVN